VIGHTDIDSQLKDCGVDITGAYQNEFQAVALLEAMQPDCIFISSIAPETYCYTLDFPIEMKIPPVVFDLGAQSERVKPLGWGIVFPISIAFNPQILAEHFLSIDYDKLWALRK